VSLIVNAWQRVYLAIARLLWNVLVVLPGSIALFTVFLSEAVSSTSTLWRRRLQGLGDHRERSGHTAVVDGASMHGVVPA